MIKNKGNFKNAFNDLSKDRNDVAFIFNDPNNKKGKLAEAVITVKDLISVSEGTVTASSKILEGFNPSYDATVVEKIKNEGGSIIAKVHSDELGLGGTGQYSGYGPIDHPLDKKRIIGGSSSGSVSTMSKDISFSLATDTGDSIRLPSSYNGLVGFKPSYGAISRYGLFPYASSLDTIGVIAHNVNDVIAASSVIFGKDDKDLTSKDVDIDGIKKNKPKTIAIIKQRKEVLSDVVFNKFEEIISELKKDGIKIEEVEIDKKLINSIGVVYDIISFSEASSNDSNLNGISFGNFKKGTTWEEIMDNTRTAGFGKMVQRRMTLGAYYLSSKNYEDIFIKAQKVRRLIVDEFNKILNKYDLLLNPSSLIAPLKSIGKEKTWLSNYLIFANLGGSPSISIPLGKEKDMPFGLNIDSKLYDDEKLLSYSLYLEEIIGGGNE